MSVCAYYCDSILSDLKSLSPKMKIVLAHESSIKDVPVNDTIAAVGIKKCVVSDMPDDKIDSSVRVETETRTILVTVGINLYVPYDEGTRGSVNAFDDIFTALVNSNNYSLNKAKLLGTKYSREAQCLVTETEFVFESFITGVIEGEQPIVPA